MTVSAEPFSPVLRRSVGVVMIGASLSFLDATVVNVAVHTLSVDLRAGLGTVQWVVTAYLLALAAVIPVTGWAARRFGAARLYVAALAVFTVGSVLCACSQSVGMLIASRAVQGVGGGAIMPVGTMIWTAHSSKAQMGRVMGLIAVPIILAPTLGPALGGLLVQGIDWRAIFWLNVPFGIVGIVLALRLLPREGGGDAGRLDVTGLLLASAGIVGVTYGLAELGTTAGLDTAAVLALLVGPAALAGFVVHALRTEQPLLDLRLYSGRTFTAASVATFALGAANYGGMILMPLYFQTVRGEGVIVAGLLLAPTGLGALLAAPLTDRHGSGVTAFTGAAVLAASTIPFVFLTAATPYTLLCLVMVVRGVGFGLSIIPAMTAAYRALPPDKIPDATPQLNVLQRVGGAIGTAVLTVILSDQLRHHPTPAGQAGGFGTTFLWVLAITIAAAVPTLVLAHTERQARRRADASEPGEAADAGH
ncbi:DHA2 family efflux MFS transporter permease subunit [Streptomyces tagetis]|uniref:DHA2 family efflux MFS transporter permease subunit n=1 Tax=Streptomyces tagetis TaxID=2820809 RepID=A0A940XJQ7_9ACTN|nr:DHA2 family efflux MFS transporter permease subunit [Streptomyces sp. RG38]MBQ0825083.1 DHA2 family efflux MFS transporter permease subunit [Streptomyces sp. RG38]